MIVGTFYSQIRCITLCILQNLKGFWDLIFCIINDLGGGRVNANHNTLRACPAWSAKTKLRMTPDCSIIAKEIVMVSGNFLREGARLLCFILARGIDIRKEDQENL